MRSDTEYCNTCLAGGKDGARLGDIAAACDRIAAVGCIILFIE